MKNIWNKFKTWFINTILPWFKSKALPWLSKNWFAFSNYFVIVFTYLVVRSHEGFFLVKTILGLWIIISIVYAGIMWIKQIRKKVNSLKDILQSGD